MFFQSMLKNATDKHVYTNESVILNGATGAISQVRGIPLTPRTIGVGFDVRF